VVSGTGVVQVWQVQHGFDPQSTPSTPPDATLTLPGDTIDALFDAWSTTNVAALPHPGPGAECFSSVSVRTCAGCNAVTLPGYANAQDLEPEMEAVWTWFDANLAVATSSNAAHPRSYCRF
jgi:hypothetical protein